MNLICIVSPISSQSLSRRPRRDRADPAPDPLQASRIRHLFCLASRKQAQRTERESQWGLSFPYKYYSAFARKGQGERAEPGGSVYRSSRLSQNIQVEGQIQCTESESQEESSFLLPWLNRLVGYDSFFFHLEEDIRVTTI